MVKFFFSFFHWIVKRGVKVFWSNKISKVFLIDTKGVCIVYVVIQMIWNHFTTIFGVRAEAIILFIEYSDHKFYFGYPLSKRRLEC